MHRVKICIVAGVAESFKLLLRPQLDCLASRGFEVHCVAAPGPYLEVLRRDGFPVHSVPLTRLIDPMRDVAALSAYYRLFRRERFDALHVHTPKASFLALTAARLVGVPVRVTTIHGLLTHDRVGPGRRRLTRLIDGAMCALSTAVLSQSAEDVETAVREGLCPRGKIRHLGQGIDLRRFAPHRVRSSRQRLRADLGIPPEAMVMLMVGRFTLEKGYREFFQMAEQVARVREDLHFMVVGNRFVERQPYDPRRAGALLGGRLTVLEDRNDLPELYACSDVMVLPTYREGMPRCLVEAGAMGLPAVASDVRGCREVVEHGVTGLLVPPRDVPALCAAVRELAADPGRRARLGKAAHARARVLFDESAVCQRVLGLYEELLGSGSAAVGADAANAAAGGS